MARRPGHQRGRPAHVGPGDRHRHHAPQGRLRHLLQRPQLPAGRPAVRRRRAHQQRRRPGQYVDLQPGGQLLAEPAAHEPGPLVPHHDRPVQRRRACGQRQRRRHHRQQPGTPGLAGLQRHVAQPEQRQPPAAPLPVHVPGTRRARVRRRAGRHHAAARHGGRWYLVRRGQSQVRTRRATTGRP